jgi:molecular chaperone DnaK (HSP70)
VTLRVGLDFGTATTCAATVTDRVGLIPEIIPIQGPAEFCDSLVWVTQPTNGSALVKSDSPHGRCPTAVCEGAQVSFDHYWKERVRAQEQGIKWKRWLETGQEQSMLLSYFKPELEDNPSPQVQSVVTSVHSTFDPLAQSEDFTYGYSDRVIANPAPDTTDLVAATAALIRTALMSAQSRTGEAVSLLVLGLPSHQALSSSGQYERAVARRCEAVEKAHLKGICTADFRVAFFGEAQAAGYGIDVDSDAAEAFSLVVDVGAGTTDMALVPYRRGRGSRLVAKDPILTDSVRFAGRNLNEAIAKAMCAEPEIKAAYEIMDKRAWQILLDRDVEHIKRNLRSDEQKFEIKFYEYAAAMDHGFVEDKNRSALKKAAYPRLSLDGDNIRAAVQAACKHWRESVAAFLSLTMTEMGPRRLAGVEMVGGAFKFAPLQHALRAAMRTAGIRDVPVRFRNVGDESQTVVARGLARRAIEM